MKNDFLKALKVGDLVTVINGSGNRFIRKVIKITKNFIYVDGKFYSNFTDKYYSKFTKDGYLIRIYSKDIDRYVHLVKSTELDYKRYSDRNKIRNISNIIRSDISNNKKVIEITKLVDSWKDGDIR